MNIELVGIVIGALILIGVIMQDNKYEVKEFKDYCCEKKYAGWLDLTVWKIDNGIIYPSRIYGESEEATYCLKEEFNITTLQEKVEKYKNAVKIIYTDYTCK